MNTIAELKQHIKEGTAIVTFKKKNGDIREMECTLASYLLPETKETSKPREANKDLTIVFDLEANGWRSFRNSSVMSIELL